MNEWTVVVVGEDILATEDDRKIRSWSLSESKPRMVQWVDHEDRKDWEHKK